MLNAASLNLPDTIGSLPAANGGKILVMALSGIVASCLLAPASKGLWLASLNSFKTNG